MAAVVSPDRAGLAIAHNARSEVPADRDRIRGQSLTGAHEEQPAGLFLHDILEQRRTEESHRIRICHLETRASRQEVRPPDEPLPEHILPTLRWRLQLFSS